MPRFKYFLAIEMTAVFDAFCDLDFASAGQQFAGTHFTHVHPDRISSAAEFGIDGRQCSFRFLDRLSTAV